MNLRKTPASSMQKTYDECYLTCSTAIYFEGQNNEAEALRAWRNALDQIYYHNAYRMPSSYSPRTETEKALHDSLRTMEMQCKERVDLLEALKKSREEAADPAQQTDSASSILSKGIMRQNSNNKVSKSEEVKQWLGNDTVPQANYADLPKVSTRQNMPSRPSNPTRPFLGARKSSDQDASRTRSLPHASSSNLTAPPPNERRSSRTPSPEKKGGMLRTLRSNGAKDARDRSSSGRSMPTSMRTKPQPAAAKAASQVWAGGRASLGSVEHLPSSNTATVPAPPVAPTQQQPTTWDPYTRSLVTASASSERHDSGHGFIRPPSPSDYIVSVSDNSEIERKRPPRTSQQSYLNSYRPNHTSSVANQNGNNSGRPPAVPAHSSSGWFSSPKVATQTSNSNPNTSKQQTDPSIPTLAQAGQAQPMTYLKEFPNHPPAKPRKPPEIAMREAANLAVSSRNAQEKTAPVPPVTRRPIDRKAIGGARAEGVVNAVAQRRQLDDKRADSHIAPTLPPVPSHATSTNLADPAPSEETQDETSDAVKQVWEQKVAALLKDLPKGVDEGAAKQILNEIVIQGDEVHWSDVAGLEAAKSALKETVVYPFLRPDLFMGLREPARGMLLFGPPGTGKTMLARAVATESKSVFFAISASSLTSKYLGDSEKLVRALFQMARAMAPSIIFVDEIDSLLGSRGGSSEHEATRRIKTEFLIQWSDLQKAAAGRVDDKNKEKGDPTRVLVLAATNLLWAIDEAARRRFVRRQYIPLPEDWVRKEQLKTLLAAQKHSMTERELAELVRLTDGFSGSDITALAKDAAMGPLRSLGEKLLHMSPEDIRPIGVQDFQASLNNIRPSVSKQGLKEFEDWAKEFGERGG